MQLLVAGGARGFILLIFLELSIFVYYRLNQSGSQKAIAIILAAIAGGAIFALSGYYLETQLRKRQNLPPDSNKDTKNSTEDPIVVHAEYSIDPQTEKLLELESEVVRLNKLLLSSRNKLEELRNANIQKSIDADTTKIDSAAGIIVLLDNHLYELKKSIALGHSGKEVDFEALKLVGPKRSQHSMHGNLRPAPLPVWESTLEHLFIQIVRDIES